ncbi:PHP domain-containing protein [Georgenia sp. 10Sc9-8]|uniref:PHP domain-containing protein n=1 Tax=Georgenia halotolerans TaxID=3028317 RepID=A0ABT5TYX2_9MICO|nr:PHP domain-containing protein [Georgenia halotolerans]
MPDVTAVDPHTHSTASDGTQTPAELLRAAAAAGIDVLGLTDHDSVRGWAEAEAAVPETGVALLRGAEISCAAEGITVHVLAYLHDPGHPDLEAQLRRTRDSREHRARRMVDRLAEDYPITWEDVLAQRDGDATVGRPHIADALVAAGSMPDRSSCFVTVLSPRGGYYLPHYAPDAVEICAAVRAAGGVPVMAHPRARLRARVVPDRVVAEMAEAGLAGLEVDHRDHDDASRSETAALARRLGLLRTGSSDYHGAGKPNVLGENLTDPEVLAAIEEAGALPLVRP